MAERGKFIVFEGIGGCGKGTQSEKLRQVLMERGKNVMLACEHTRDTPTGQLIEEIIKKRAPSIEADALQMLFVADRINHTQRVILPALGEGVTVIGDRYRGSTIAYAREEKRDYYNEIQKRVTLAPDLVIILDLDPVEAVRRVNGRGDADIFDQVEN
jgi:dTMP kinase